MRGDDPGSMAIASALYHAFLPKPQSQEWWPMYGLPRMIYIDNGKDWISRHIEVGALTFDIKLERHEPYHPQSKGKIERLFRTLEDMCIHPLDGSVGSNTRTRPKKITPNLTMEQVRVQIERFIRDYSSPIQVVKSNTFANYPVSRSAGSRWIRPSPVTCARSRRNKPGSGFSNTFAKN